VSNPFSRFQRPGGLIGRAGGGGASSASGPPTVPPLLAELIHWYDFDDLSTLWQDLAGTIPITTPGQSIQRIDDKGLFNTELIDASAGQFRSPFWQITGGTGEYSSPPGGFNKVLSSQVSPGIAGLERSLAFVVDRDNADSGTVYPTAWNLNSGMAVDQFSNNQLQAWSSGGGVNGNFISRSLLGVILVHRFTNFMEIYDSEHAGFLQAANASFAEPIANRDLSVGALTTGSGNDWRGTIKEVLYWRGALSVADIDIYKAFTDNKYGVVWT